MPKYTNAPNSMSVLDQTLPFASGGSSSAGKLEDDHTEAFNQWKADPTPDTRGALLKSVSPVISTAIHSYAPSGGPNIKSKARLMALKAFDSYDPAKGNMKTHLLSQLRGLQRTQGQANQIIRIPERVVLDRQHLAETESRMQDELGRDPSDLEIANATGLSLKRIGHIRNAKPGTNTGSIIDEEGEVFSPASSIPGASDNDDAWAQMVYYDLDEVNQGVMDYTLGWHGAPQLENREIAQRLGITPSAVSQRKAKIQAMLDEQYNVF